MSEYEPEEEPYPLLPRLGEAEELLAAILVESIDTAGVHLSMYGAETLARRTIDSVHEHLIALDREGLDFGGAA